jgi:prepilin-type N-terminal cleavage/methylation domain-containing protein
MMRRKGFTLVELVVVILILGILAGVAAPKMLNTSAKATDNGLKQTLSIVRDAIEMYQAETGRVPDPADGPTFITNLQPYMRGAFPKSPVHTGGSADDVLVATNSTPTGATGWLYNKTTGEFICNLGTASATVSGVTYNQF